MGDGVQVDQFARSSRRTALLTVVAGGFVLIGLLASFVGTRKSEEKVVELEREAREQKEKHEEREAKRIEAERHISEGVMLAGRGQITRAIASYEKAIALDPDNASAYQFRGYALLRRAQGRPESRSEDLPAAIVSLEKAVEVDPKHVWAHYNLALAYMEAGEKNRALEEVRRVIAIDPSFRDKITKDVQFNRFRRMPEFNQLIPKTPRSPSSATPSVRKALT